MKKNILMFDASIQKICEHEVTVDGNGEYVITSIESGRFTKLPADTTAEELNTNLQEHNAGNTDQVSMEQVEVKAAEIVDELQVIAPEEVVDATVVIEEEEAPAK